MRIIVTGGAGFIGSCFVAQRVASGDEILNLDKLTYSGNLCNLESVLNKRNYHFVKGDIGDKDLVSSILRNFSPNAIVNFAAETHVDRSIKNPNSFIDTNVVGTSNLLFCVKEWWSELPQNLRKNFRFHHISTDEVFGSLSLTEPAFTEKSQYAPNSPYSASKAASDHFVRAYNETYGLPTLITNCSNNYGPRQFPEKLIPLMIINGIKGLNLPIYGTGENIRDWLHVEDHCEAIYKVLTCGRVGETYNIGGRSEKKNIDVVYSICKNLDELLPRSDKKSYTEQIVHVTDRLGHDFRYAIDCNKIETEIGWFPRYSFDEGLKETIRWYLSNKEWIDKILSGEYKKWIASNYFGR